jgi:hypothetical protein
MMANRDTKRSRLDQALEAFENRFSALSKRGQAALFAASGEGLLRLYDQFVQEAGWGDPSCFQSAGDAVWIFAQGGQPLSESGRAFLDRTRNAGR